MIDRNRIDQVGSCIRGIKFWRIWETKFDLDQSRVIKGLEA